MEIYLEKRILQQIRISAQDAIDHGDNETLREDIHDMFSEGQIEEIERRIDGGDFHDFVNELLEEWGGDDVEELMELVEAQLSDAGIDLKQSVSDFDDEEPEDDEDVSEEEEELDITAADPGEGDDDDDIL